jgi:1-acyl-sn-glycerol-3-phosphate acyltransferase
MYQILLTIYFWTFGVLSLLLVTPICFLLYPFIEQKTFSRIYGIVPAYILSVVMKPFWQIEIKDLRQNKNWDKEFVIVANHLSFSDSLFLSLAVPKKAKFMIANVFTKIPIFGHLSLWSGHVTADRNDPELNKDAVERAVKTIKKDNSSFILFPESRRELISYEFEKFKTGAYRIAQETDLQILPITLVGTEKAIGFGAIVDFAKIQVYINDPFFVEDNNYEKYIKRTVDVMKKNINLTK